MKINRLRKSRNAGPSAKDYLKIVEWSDEDGCFVGSAPPIIGPCCHGDDEAAVYRQLVKIVEEWVEILRKEGRPLPSHTVAKTYSGTFNLRIGRALHKALAIRALQEDESLNSYCARVLERAT